MPVTMRDTDLVSALESVRELLKVAVPFWRAAMSEMMESAAVRLAAFCGRRAALLTRELCWLDVLSRLACVCMCVRKLVVACV
jgi:hypothetical protein